MDDWGWARVVLDIVQALAAVAAACAAYAAVVAVRNSRSESRRASRESSLRTLLEVLPLFERGMTKLRAPDSLAATLRAFGDDELPKTRYLGTEGDLPERNGEPLELRRKRQLEEVREEVLAALADCATNHQDRSWIDRAIIG